MGECLLDSFGSERRKTRKLLLVDSQDGLVVISDPHVCWLSRMAAQVSLGLGKHLSRKGLVNNKVESGHQMIHGQVGLWTFVGFDFGCRCLFGIAFAVRF